MKKLFFETIDSTNSYLKRNYQNLEDMTFISASFQSEGRGRMGRSWMSEKGRNLTFSLLIKDPDAMKEYAKLSVLSAFSIAEVLKDYEILDVSIKWPNDVYVKDAKICGILLEAVSAEEMECLIIGIGLNVNEENFSEAFLCKATSMKLCTGKKIDLEELKEAVYQRLADNIVKMKRGKDFHEKITALDYLKGKKAFCRINDEERQIEVLGIDRDYSLKVLCDGIVRNLSSSEITFHI